MPGGRAGASDSAIGRLPRPEDLDLQGLDLAPQALAALFAIDPALWRKEIAELREYLGRYGTHVPGELLAELDTTERRLG